MQLPDLRNFDLKGKRVLVRCDFDVPLENGIVADDTRIQSSLPTIQYLLNQNAKVILLAHLGRPEGQVDEELSLKPVFEKLQELLPQTNFQFSIFNQI
jgi:phosphoglycerate kinase